MTTSSTSCSYSCHAARAQDYPWLSTRPGGCKCFEYVRKHGFRSCPVDSARGAGELDACGKVGVGFSIRRARRGVCSHTGGIARYRGVHVSLGSLSYAACAVAKALPVAREPLRLAAWTTAPLQRAGAFASPTPACVRTVHCYLPPVALSARVVGRIDSSRRRQKLRRHAVRVHRISIGIRRVAVPSTLVSCRIWPRMASPTGTWRKGS